jgi:TolB-like protein/DNA-binding winged helix-turn-helix (wHTH) protein
MAIHVLGPFRLDTQDNLLFRGSEPVALGQRAIALLRTLVERPGALVSKDALIEAAWSGRLVEENNLPVQIAALRRMLGEAPGGDRWIKTLPGRGYRFIGPTVAEVPRGDTTGSSRDDAEPDLVPMLEDHAERRQPPRETEQPASSAAAETAEPVQPMSLPPTLSDGPSIAVLPFQNMSGDPEQEYFADGMVEEIITALSRIRWLFVLARNSSFTYKGQPVDVKQVGRELGVQYVLEGSVRKAGSRVRITGQLIDAITAAHLWADRFDGSLGDVFDLQDKVASSVAGVIEPALQSAETARSTSRPTNDLTAYDLYLRAYAIILSSRQFAEGLRLMEQAIARDPRYGPALAWAAVCCSVLRREDQTDDNAGHRLKGVDFARRALEVAGDDPGVLAHAAQALTYFGEDIGTMMALVDRALALNPNYARGWHISGILRMSAGQPEIAIAHTEAAMRLSPRARIGTPFAVIGQSLFLSRRFDEAVPKLLLAIQDDPSYPVPYRVLAACYAHMGRLGDAQKILERLRTIPSVVIPDVSYLRKPEHRELFLSGLRLAAAEI